MKRTLKVLGGIITLVIIAGGIAFFIFWSRMPDIISSMLSKKLLTTVEIGDIKLATSGVSVEGFDIYNPKGYRLAKAFASQIITIQTSLKSLLEDDIVIEEIHLDNVYIGLEFESIRSTKGNWKTILANAQKAKEGSTPSKSNKTVFIKRLLLNNINAELYYQTDQKIRKLKPIPQIELRNISSQGGNLSDQLMNSALGEAVKQIFIQENLKDVFDQLLQSPTSPIQDYLGPLKNLFNYHFKENDKELLAKTQNEKIS
jgi:hypothetical protein